MTALDPAAAHTGSANARPWRFLVTGFSFALFGIGGAMLGSVAVPLLWLWPGSRSARQRRMRRLVSAAFRAFVGVMHGLRGLDYDLSGFERLGRPGQLIVANHPSLIDVVFLIAFVPGAGCVVKSSLWRNPAMALVVRGAGYVPNHPTDVMIDGAAAALAEGQAVIMFPEGTRTRPGQPMHFHRGAASVAARTARCVTPVFITVSPTTLTKHEPWYRIPRSRPRFCLRVGEDLDPGVLSAGRPLPQASRAINTRLESTYASELPGY
jgi:1-acyl-sn-glycerol-3-phosphate acyltransferase